jgi:hypothetical protein
MDMVKFAQDGIKHTNNIQKTLQGIVGILFDGFVDVNSKITINGLRNDFGDKPRFTVLYDIVVIRFADIFHAVSIPVNHEYIKKAIGKFIKQLKDKYTIKVISRPGGEVINGIGSEPTLIISGFTEEELDILRGNSAIPNRLINIGYNNHKFALIEKEAKPGSNYIIFDDIETMLNYKESIKDQYGIESEVYHIDTNNFDLEKVNIYGKLYERYYFTSESLPMVKVEFKPSDDFITKSVFEDIIIISGCYNSDNIDYQREIDNFIKNFGGKDINGFTPTSIDVYLSGGYDDFILAYKKPLNNDTNIIPFILFQEFINSSETIKRVINDDIVIYIGALSSKLLAYHLNLGISDIVNDHGAFTILDNDTREDNDGFYLVPNSMSSYVRPMLPSEGNNDRSVGKVFEPHEAIQLPEGEYVLFKNVYFKRTLAKTEGSYVYRYYPLELMVKYSEIGKYLANSSDENKDTIFPDNKLIYCNNRCGVETPMFNYNTVDEVLTYTDVVTGSESSFKNTSTHIYKIAEGIYGRTDIKYEFTDSTDDNNPLEPFYEYLPR